MNNSIKIQINGNDVLIDKEDLYLFERADIRWSISAGYVQCSYGEYRHIPLHRVLLKYDGALHVDHINRNKLDNRKENLRLCTPSENQHNSDKKQSFYSKYKGVCFWERAKTKKWVSYINFNGKRYNLGYFLTEQEAAKAYDKKAKELCIKFAILNFPNE